MAGASERNWRVRKEESERFSSRAPKFPLPLFPLINATRLSFSLLVIQLVN